MSRERLCRRIYVVHVIILLAFCCLLLRIFLIGQGEDYTSAAATQSKYTLSAGSSRGMIYDCNLKPLVNRIQKTYLAVDPQPEAVTKLKEELPQAEFEALLPQLESGTPALLSAPFSVTGEGITAVTVAERYEQNQLAPHVIGYVNGEGKGVCGIESGYEDQLARWGGSVKIRYTVNAWHMAVGGQPEVQDTRGSLTAGVVLSLDRDLQRIAEDVGAVLGRGAVVLMEVDTGEIRAMASFPDYDVNNVASSLESEDGPLLNRAVSAWNVGSIFKICVAASALEGGVDLPQDFGCLGYYQLGTQKYYCHNRSGHGAMNLTSAFEVSCNPYFVEVGQRTGARQLLRMAETMGFGSATMLAEGITAAAGTLPTLEETTVGELANLSFGQGRLTATPVQIARMIAMVANGGYDVHPTLIEGVTDDGAVLEQATDRSVSLRVISPATAETLRQMMVDVVEEGTGGKAKNVYCGSGGKTASAQTGTFVEGAEIVHAWFGGFFPAEEPKYALVVFQEGGQSGGQTTAEVFRTISEAVYLHEHPGFARTLG